jgi:hypothetical protein
MDQTILTTPHNLTQSQTDLLNSKITIPNLAAIGAWNSIKAYNASQIVAGAIAGVMTSLTRDDVMLWSALSESIFDLFIKDYKTCDSMIFQNVQGLSETQKQLLWNDPNFGFQTSLTLNGWMKATTQGIDSDMAIILNNHYHMQKSQTMQLINTMQKLVDAGQASLANLFSCPQNACTSKYLAAIQWASQNITQGVPLPSIPPVPSITNLNLTVFGYPEFSYFYTELFKPANPEPEWQNITMDIETAYRLVDANLPNEPLVQGQYALTNQYNCAQFWKTGEKYDLSEDLNDLQPAKERFGLKDLYQTRVLWAYMKYIKSDFATFGYNVTAGAKGLLSTYMNNDVYATWHDLLHLTVKSKMLVGKLDALKISCQDFVQNSAPTVTAASLAKVCAGDSVTEELAVQYIDYCYWQTEPKFKATLGLWDFTKDQAHNFCGINSEALARKNLKLEAAASTFNELNAIISRDMSSQYKCVFDLQCNRQELLSIQWTGSQITRNPVSYIANAKSTDSITDWVPNTPVSHFRFEMPEFQKFYKLPSIPTFTTAQATKLITYDKMLAALSLGKAIAELYLNKTSTWAESAFFMPDATVLDKYLKYSIIEGFFEGLSMKKSFKETVFGFTSAPLEKLRTKDVMLGGDPTIDSAVSMIMPAETIKQTRHTGVGNSELNDAFASIEGADYINWQQTMFNGTHVYNETSSPWASPVKLSGGDNLFGPRLDKTSVPKNYQVDFYRAFNFDYQKEVSYKGGDLNTYRYKINDTDFDATPANKIYYQDKYNGAMNLTSTKRAPVFLTKRYFLNADENLFTKIQMLDSKGHPVAKSEDDELTIDINPTTGVPVKAVVTIQINVEVPNDELFSSMGDTLYPVLTLTRGVELTDAQIQSLFGSLMLIQNHQTMIRVILIILTILIVLGGILFFICLKKRVDKEIAEQSGAGKMGIREDKDYVNIDQIIEDDVVRGPKVKVTDPKYRGSDGKMAKDSGMTKDTMGTAGGIQNRLSEF